MARLALLALLLAPFARAGEEPDAFDRLARLLESDGRALSDLALKDRELLRGRATAREHFPSVDPHLLPAVREAMDRPWEVSRRLRRTADEAAGARSLLDALLAVQPYHRPVPGGGGVGGGPRAAPDEVFQGRLDGEAAQAVSEICRAARAAAHLSRLAFDKLDDDERGHLAEWLPRWVGRTTDEDRERAQQGGEDVAERRALLRCARLWERVDEAPLLAAWHGMVREIERWLPRLAGQEEFRGKIDVADDLGPIRIRGHGNDRIDADAFVIIDFGGDDEYRRPPEAARRAVSVVIDLDGNDLYLGQAPFSWGAALLGLGLHVDLAGDDDYRAADFGLGAALGGHAALWDRDGNDRYYGGLGCEGAGVFGTGALVDGAGDDEYAADSFCQGFGSSAGLGALLDRGGNDVYVAGRDEEDIWRRPRTFITFAQGAAYSHRFGHIYTDDTGRRRWKITGQVPGGCGLLLDRAGDDRYEADVFGQGSAYWYGLGGLVDGGGDDRYRATWYGQGVGTHAAVGCVVDVAGDDWYHSRTTSQGCGHDFSAGILHDLAGDDRYFGVGLCQGAGSNAMSGVGILIDERGDDAYRCTNRCWGFAPALPAQPEAAPFGFFLDLAGIDRYEGKSIGLPRPGGRWRQGERGYGVDGR